MRSTEKPAPSRRSNLYSVTVATHQSGTEHLNLLLNVQCTCFNGFTFDAIDTHYIRFCYQNLNNSKPSDPIKQQDDDEQGLANGRNDSYYFK